jgi:DNA-directed RNA polymerase subunit RPC12/RpoP
MSQAFSCPNCSAPLDYQAGSASTMRCPYCQSSIIIPQGLRSENVGEALENRPGLNFSGTTVQSSEVVALDQTTLAHIQSLLRQGNNIEAIKIYRQATGCALAESVQAISAIEETLQVAPGVLPGDAYRNNTLNERRSKRITRGIGAATAGVSCFTIGLTGFILLVTVVPIFFAMTSNGGPLADWWARTNPLSANPIELQFGGEGSGVGVFTDARHVGVDNQGHIFVGEFEGGRIQVFDTNGMYITQWNARGIEEGDVYLTGMAVDRNSIVYAVVGSELYRYNGMTGELLGNLPHPDGWGFDDVTVGSDGSVAATWYKNRDDLIRFNRDGQMDLLVQSVISGPAGDSELSMRVAEDGAGNLYVLGSFTESVFIYTSDGRYASRFGSEGEAAGQFTSTYAIGVDNQSRIYLSDFGGVMVYASDGRYLKTIPVNGFVYGMCFDDQNNLYLVTGNEQVLRMRIK